MHEMGSRTKGRQSCPSGLSHSGSSVSHLKAVLPLGLPKGVMLRCEHHLYFAEGGLATVRPVWGACIGRSSFAGHHSPLRQCHGKIRLDYCCQL